VGINILKTGSRKIFYEPLFHVTTSYTSGHRGAEENLDNSQLIIAISPDTIPDRWFPPGDRPVRWVYLGKNVLTGIRLQKNLDHIFSELDISRRLEEVADTIRSEHVTWIDAINQKYGADIRWWFGNVSSRNIYSSDLFQSCCYLVLLEQVWESPAKKPSLIIVDSPGLASAIDQWAQKKGIQVSVRGDDNHYARKMVGIVRFGMRWGDFIATTCMRKLASVTIRTEDVTRKTYDRDLIIINTFVHDSSLSEEGAFKDRYLPGLDEYLRKNNKAILVHPVFYGFGYNFFPIFKRISRSATDFIIQEKYLNILDYLRAWFYPVHLLGQTIRAPAFHGFDMNEIIREDQINGDLQNTLQAVLTFYLVKRLKKRGLIVHSLIGWYENQILDRAIIAGMREAYPETKTTGAQIYLRYPNFLSLFPSTSEAEAGVVPDILLATSQYQCRLSRVFAPSLHCRPAAALRYAHVFTEAPRPEPLKSASRSRVLVLTSGIWEEAVELLILTQDLTKRLGKKTEIHVQLHPDIRIDEITRQFPEIQADNCVKIVKGLLADELQEASVVISKSSGAIVEAVAKGMPTIFVANRNKINLNPMAGIATPLLTECYSVDEVIDAIQKYLNAPETDRKKYRDLGRSVRDQFFLPVNDDTLSPYLIP
jgi:hypothetical protein